MSPETVEPTRQQTAPEKRSWIYVQRPVEYGIAPCGCGNSDPDWSEFQGHLWCGLCTKDFMPEHSGVFDWPIPTHTATMLGMCFDRINLGTRQVEKYVA